MLSIIARHVSAVHRKATFISSSSGLELKGRKAVIHLGALAQDWWRMGHAAIFPSVTWLVAWNIMELIRYYYTLLS